MSSNKLIDAEERWTSNSTDYDIISGTESAYIREVPRKSMPVYRGVVKYFPDALKEVSKVSLQGNIQHHPDKELHWDKSKSTDNADALMRHLIDHAKSPIDDDGHLHLAKVAWRALATLQIYLEHKGDVE